MLSLSEGADWRELQEVEGDGIGRGRNTTKSYRFSRRHLRLSQTSLGSTSSGPIIEPDYGKPLVSVYIDAVFCLYQHPRPKGRAMDSDKCRLRYFA